MCSMAQYFNYGQNRSTIQWKKIESIHFEIIYPEGFDAKALEISLMMEDSYRFVTQSLNHKPKKVSVILHTETVKSNAFLGWAPSRIEMFTTPHQGIYSQDWLEQLAIHEYRHMVQLSKVESEMPRLLRWLFGEQAAAAITAAYLPFWFIEGDAVAAETALSTSGRGRLPGFHQQLRTQLIENGKYSYDKAYLGSYKNNVANYYQMGYFMVAGARKLYDQIIWDEVVSHVATKPFSFVAFDKGLRNSIGLNKIQLYDTVFNYLENRWKTEDNILFTTGFDAWPNQGQKYFTNYQNVFLLNDSTIIAERIGLQHISTFITLDRNGNEKKIFTPGYYFRHSLSFQNGHLIWSEPLPHPRWEHSESSLLRVLNIENKQLIEYKFKSKLFAPVFSPNLNKIAVVEAGNHYNFNLIVIDSNDGKIIQRLENPENDYIITPSWSADGKSLYAVLLRENKKSIAKINIETSKVDILFPFDNQEILKPVEFKDGLLFIGAYTGIDNIYYFDIENEELYSVVESRFGIADFSLSENKLLFSNYTANGYEPAVIHLDSLEFSSFYIDTQKSDYPIADAISKQESGVIQFSKQSDIDYKSVKYNKTKNFFNLHSWAPVSIDPYKQNVLPGVSVISQNMLSTAEFTAGYRYKPQQTRGEFYASTKYMGLYPVIEAEVNNANKESYFYKISQYLNQNNEVYRTDTVKTDFVWNETNLSIGANVPLNLSKGAYYRLLNPRIRYQLTNISPDNNAHSSFPNGIYQTLEGRLYMYNIFRQSRQQLQPRLGFVFDASYALSLPGVLNFGHIHSIAVNVFLPGFHINHGISFYYGFQQKNSGQYAFSDKIKYPRGHLSRLNDKMYTFMFDYHLPLFYPDLDLGRLAYIKRFTMKAFYDLSLYNGVNQTNNLAESYRGFLQSTGIELKADLNLLRFIAPMEFGVRSSYLFDGSFRTEFLYSIQFDL